MIGAEKTHDLRRRLGIGEDAAVAAEWEIAIVSCLARQGRIEAIAPRKGVRELEVIYTGSSGNRIAIEVTALSDQSFHQRNPVRAFTSELIRIQIKRGIHKLGAIHYEIGSKDDADGPVLGVPARQAMASFFASEDFRAFIDAIRSAPAARRTLPFELHGVKSCLSFEPGARYGGGTHRVFTLPLDVRNNPITWRLKDKDSQVSHSGLGVPCVVFLCDADCYLLSRERITANTISAHQVIDLFLNGRRAGPYPGSRSRSRRINGVVTCRTKEEGSRSRVETPRRHAVIDLIRNRSETYYALRESDLEEIGDCIRHLPRIARSPVNARTESKRPEHYGGLRTHGGGPGKMKIEMSLLTLQQLLAGTLSSEEFTRDNDSLVAQFKRATERGMMISALNIKPCADEDDDWVEIELSAIAPSHLFKDDPNAGS
jgi:hypothetical protein